MKKNKLRKVFTLVCSAILLVGISVGATVAYLTSSDDVTNTFTAGKVKITLDEAKVDEFGNETNEAARVQANTYRLLPGHTYAKDPTVHVEGGSDDCYIFVEITNEIEAIEADTTIHNQILANRWYSLAGVPGVYYREHEYAAAKTDYVVFEDFTILGTVDNDTLAAYENKTVKVTAYAIQKDGFTDANAAWVAGSKTQNEGGWAANP